MTERVESPARRDAPPRDVAKTSGYLRALGLDETSSERRARELLAVVDGDSRLGAGQAVGASIDRVESWLDELSAPEQGGTPRPRGLVASLVRESLAQDPELFLRRGPLPEELRTRIAGLPSRLRPGFDPMPVQTHPLGRLLALFQAMWWRERLDRARIVGSSALQTLRGR